MTTAVLETPDYIMAVELFAERGTHALMAAADDIEAKPGETVLVGRTRSWRPQTLSSGR